MAELPARGYLRYEISNFARPGYESRHNLGYWRSVPYLGVGAGAHGYIDNVRWENERAATAYIRTVTAGGDVRHAEGGARTQTAAMEEYAFLALRTAAGIDEADFRRAWGTPFEAVYGAALPPLVARGLLRRADGFTALTPRGMKFGNEVFAEFLLY